MSRHLTPRQSPRDFSVAARCRFGPTPPFLNAEKSSLFGTPLDHTPDHVGPSHEGSVTEDIQNRSPLGSVSREQDYLNHDSPKTRSKEGLPRMERTGAVLDATLSSVQQQMKALSEHVDVNSAKQAARLERGFNNLAHKLARIEKRWRRMLALRSVQLPIETAQNLLKFLVIITRNFWFETHAIVSSAWTPLRHRSISNHRYTQRH